MNQPRPDQQCFYCDNRGEIQHGNRIRCHVAPSVISGKGYFAVPGFPVSFRPDYVRTKCPSWVERQYPNSKREANNATNLHGEIQNADA